MPYSKHVFVCINDYEGKQGKQCCNQYGSAKMQHYMKRRCKDLNLTGEGKVRINKAGCLNRCEQGPVMVVYPEGVWYNWVDTDDIDEIIDKHLINDQVVERLLLPD